MAETNLDVESKPLQSRKFLAYLIAEATWKVVLGAVLVMGMKNGTIDVIIGALALTIVLVAGFIESGYILGQASLDKYTRIAQIAVQNGKGFSMKGLQVTHNPAPDANSKGPPTKGKGG